MLSLVLIFHITLGCGRNEGRWYGFLCGGLHLFPVTLTVERYFGAVGEHNVVLINPPETLVYLYQAYLGLEILLNVDCAALGSELESRRYSSRADAENATATVSRAAARSFPNFILREVIGC